MIGIEWIQYILNFEFFTNPQFTSPYGLGRVGFIGTILGIFVGFHLCCVIILSAAFLLLRIQDENHVLLELSWTFSPWILLLWSVYILFLSLFHTSEFLITALYNPNTVTADSFVVNHSQTYTAAVLLSFMEFWIEALFVPSIKRNYKILNILGLLLIIGGSSCRLVAMATCGPNFHHKIQLEQATGHTLVTHGMYVYKHIHLFSFSLLIFLHNVSIFIDFIILVVFGCFVTYFFNVCIIYK